MLQDSWNMIFLETQRGKGLWRKASPSVSCCKGGNRGPGIWRHEFEEKEKTFYETGTKLDTLKYSKYNHLWNKQYSSC